MNTKDSTKSSSIGTNVPEYYIGKFKGIEAFDVVQDFAHDNYNLGVAIAYLLRAGKKAGNPAEQDINKAIIHLKRELQQLEDYAVLYQPRSQASDRFDSDGGCESFR
jgi:hypothetical protein